jgi:NadR type nicotinamide-nucleotide adenylyltransferase
MQPLKKIVVIGPESTGKSTLCEQLAAHYQTLWVEEYAREYLLRHGKQYKYEDLLTIAKGQLALEDEYIKKVSDQITPPHSLLFIDTDMYVMKVWSEFVFGNCDPWILNQILTRRYDGYLLCCTDLPWVKDELREYPDPITREKLFHIYKDSMVNQNTPWAEIGGKADQRLQAAIDVVNKLNRAPQTS